MSVRVISYNLLVPIFAEQPGYYIKCDPRYLQTTYRWSLIQTQLQQEIIHHKNTIVCLQEVSRTLLRELKSFFHRLNYILLYKLYGEQHDDYMGVGIAIPSSMKLTSVSYFTIADQLRAHLHEKGPNVLNLGKRVRDYLLNKSAEPVSDSWDIAITKSNVLIVLKIIVDGIPLCIGTYHMPCMFKSPDVMIIHSSMVKDMMINLANGQNLILAGDFNFKPTDASYRVVTNKGFLRGRLPQSSKYLVSYRPNVEQVLNSAYREKNGAEPNFTNFVATAKTSSFCGTLDYIFYYGRLTVEKVLKLPNHPTGKSYPDATHPSDHLMIAASFRFF